MRYSDLPNVTIIYGPPGCGKTFALREHIERLARIYGPEKILVTSFSRAAAEEIKGRDLPLAKHQTGTLHAHCYHLLKKPKIAELQVSEFNARNPFFTLSGASVDLDNPITDQPSLRGADKLLTEYSRLRSLLKPRDLWPSEVRVFAEKWEAWKSESSYVDYTDMIDIIASQNHVTMPHQTSVLIVDEAQDLTPMQHLLVMKWAKFADEVLIAGDDDQTVYQHTGATAEYLIDPDLPAERRIVLGRSYRVPASIQRVAQRLIKQVRSRVDKVYTPRIDEETGEITEGTIAHSSATWVQPERVIAHAEKMIAAGKSCLFLASCSYMLDSVITVLRDRGIPFHNPLRRTNGAWNPLSSGSGTPTKDRILAYLRPQNDVWGDEARIWTAGDLDLWLSIIKGDGVCRRGAKKRLDDLIAREEYGREMEISTPDLVTEYFYEDSFGHAYDGDLGWLEDHLIKSKQNGAAFPLKIAKTHGAAMLREQPKIAIGTIHSYKGGEADCVYLFPDLSTAANQEWNTRRDGHDAILRTFYVGITRAREFLCVCDPAGASVHIPITAAHITQPQESSRAA